jgi:hypothetical protein
MSAGVPGLGLGGLFFVLSALAGPAIELVRTLAGASSRGAWSRVWRQFGIAVAMIVAVDLSLRACFLLIGLAGAAAPDAGGVTVLPLTQFALATAALFALLAGAKALQLFVRLRARRRARAAARRPHARLVAELD